MKKGAKTAVYFGVCLGVPAFFMAIAGIYFSVHPPKAVRIPEPKIEKHSEEIHYNEPAAEPVYKENTSGAWVMAQHVIEDRLIDPKSADWGSIWDGNYQRFDDAVKYLGDKKYIVSGWVRSKNRLGGVVLTTWVAILKDEGSRGWSLVSEPIMREH